MALLLHKLARLSKFLFVVNIGEDAQKLTKRRIWYLRKLVKFPILMNMTNTKLVSTAEVALLLNVHRATVTRMVEQGKLKPAVRGEGIRGSMFFYRSEVERYKRAEARRDRILRRVEYVLGRHVQGTNTR